MSDLTDERLLDEMQNKIDAAILAASGSFGVSLDAYQAHKVGNRVIDAIANDVVALRLAASPPSPAAGEVQDGWFLAAKSLSEPARAALADVIELAKHAHMTDVMLRVNGDWKRFEADWIKYLSSVPAGNAESRDAVTEQMLVDAYVRGIEWADENPFDLEYGVKAARDYADKTLSLKATPASWGEVTEEMVDAAMNAHKHPSFSRKHMRAALRAVITLQDTK